MTEVRTSEQNRDSLSANTWLHRLNRSEHVLGVLFTLSFLETTILPIPIELILLPFMVANRHRLWRTAFVVTAGCLAGSLVGYGTGFFAYDSLGRWLVETMSWQEGYQQFQVLFDRHGFLAILMVGILPIPFQAAMLAAGTAGYTLWSFVLATLLARGVRYFGLAFLVYIFGKKAENIWMQNRITALLALTLAIITFWLAARWLSSSIF